MRPSQKIRIKKPEKSSPSFTVQERTVFQNGIQFGIIFAHLLLRRERERRICIMCYAIKLYLPDEMSDVINIMTLTY